MTKEVEDVFDAITADDQMIIDIYNLDKKLRYYGFRPVGVIVSYQAKFLMIRDLRHSPIPLLSTLDGHSTLFGLVMEADPKYKDRDFCIVLITGERVKSIDVEPDSIRGQTKFTLDLDDKIETRYSLTKVEVTER